MSNLLREAYDNSDQRPFVIDDEWFYRLDWEGMENLISDGYNVLWESSYDINDFYGSFNFITAAKLLTVDDVEHSIPFDTDNIIDSLISMLKLLVIITSITQNGRLTLVKMGIEYNTVSSQNTRNGVIQIEINEDVENEDVEIVLCKNESTIMYCDTLLWCCPALCCGLCILILIISLLFLIAGVPPIVVIGDKNAQLEIVEDITGSEVVQVERLYRYGIALTEDGQVCTLKSRRKVNCIEDFHQGVAIRYNDMTGSRHTAYNYLILTNYGVVYEIVYDGYYIPSSYIFNTWSRKELSISGPIKYYQEATISGDNKLITISGPIYVYGVINGE